MRPKGLVPIVASDVLYPAGTDPWSGTLTKVSPGPTQIAAGFVAGARLPASNLNYLLNQFGLWLDYQDTAEVRTWTPVLSVNVYSDATENVFAWDTYGKKFLFAGSSIADNEVPKVFFSNNGVNWDDYSLPVVTPSGGQQQRAQICCGEVPSLGVSIAWNTKGAHSKFYFLDAIGNWTLSAGQPALITAQIARWCNGEQQWYVFGHNGTNPHIWTLALNGVWTDHTLQNQASFTHAFILAAVSASGIAVAITDDYTIWTRYAGSSTWVNRASLASNPTGLVWSETEALFFVTCEDGTVHSAPGVGVIWTWTLRATLPDVAFLGCQNGPGGLAALGGLVVAPCILSVGGGDTTEMLAIGRDRGTLWDLVPLPTRSGALLSGLPLTSSIATLDGRLVSLITDDAGTNSASQYAYSLRVKP